MIVNGNVGDGHDSKIFLIYMVNLKPKINFVIAKEI